MADEIIDHFLTIIPDDEKYMGLAIDPIPLSVVRGDGVNMTPDVKITVNDLNNGQKRFINNSGQGDKFKVTAIIRNDETIEGMRSFTLQGGKALKFENGEWETPETVIQNIDLGRLIDALDYWIKEMTVFSIVTDAIDIPNGKYIVTGNGGRKQTLEHYTSWELEFTRYPGEIISQVTWDNTYANKAIKKYNDKKKKNTKKKQTTNAKKASTTNNKFKKCKLSSFSYTKTQKKVDCVVQLQNILKKKGYYKTTVDGWYYKKTLEAVKAFQKAYNKQQKKSKTVVTNSSTIVGTSNKKNLITLLPENGKVDKTTFNALCKV